ncbi:hypothetical protein EDD11_004587 [Mortierella claussenii]|nr:hypothetical protein EDD11_004587 [Mortierella claussenii]
MKFIAAAAAVASLAAVSAQTLQISNPTAGTVWTSGGDGYISWSGNCANLGNNSSKTVEIQLVDGPSTAVRYVATIGQLDCSGSTFNKHIVVPDNVTSATYSLRVLTQPESYSQQFQLNNNKQPATPTDTPSATTTGAPSPTKAPSAASSLAIGSFAAILGTAVAALQLVL